MEAFSIHRGLFRFFGVRHPSSVPGYARSTFPVGEGDLRRGLSYPLLGEGGRAVGPDGCGAGRRTDLVPPLIRRCGGTFPQGKVRERLRRGLG